MVIFVASGGLSKMSNIKFCFKLNKSATKTHQMLQQAYGDTAVTLKTVCKGFVRFREGKESLDDDERSGRPSTSRNDDNIVAVKTIKTKHLVGFCSRFIEFETKFNVCTLFKGSTFYSIRRTPQKRPH